MSIISPSLISNSHFEKNETTPEGNPKRSQISQISSVAYNFLLRCHQGDEGSQSLEDHIGSWKNNKCEGALCLIDEGTHFWNGQVVEMLIMMTMMLVMVMMLIDRIHTFGMVNTMDLRIFWLGMIEQHPWLEWLGITSWYFRFCKEISDFKSLHEEQW